MKYSIIKRAMQDFSVNESRTCLRTRKKILHNAYSLFSNKGFFLASMVDLADKAEITRRTLYNYYDNLSEVLQALHPLVLDSFKEKITQDLLQIPAETLSLRDFFEPLYFTLTKDKHLFSYILQTEYYLSSSKNELADTQSFSQMLSGLMSSYFQQSDYLMVEFFLSFLNQEFSEGTKTKEDHMVSFELFSLFLNSRKKQLEAI